MSALARWRGLKALVQDGVEHGSRAVEDVHMETARRPFVVLALIPPVAKPARLIHVVHDAALSSVYGSIRLVNRLVGGALDVVLDAIESADNRAARDADVACEMPERDHDAPQ